MKIIYSVLLILMFASISYSQNASTFFPSSPGYKWYYKNTPLDSINNPLPELSTYQIDSFSTVENYQGLLSSTVLSKTGLLSINQNTPYLDTNHYNFQSTNGFYYLNLKSYINLIPFLDSITVVNFLRSFEKWYNVYRFAQTVNTNYTIFSRDTTLTVDTLILPLRISMTGRRLNDQTVLTVNGNLLAKKFLITFNLSYGILPPFIYIPVVTRPDTTYISADRWKIKDVIPSTNVDLTALGFPVAFSIPGNVTELTNGPTGISSESGTLPGSFELSQNFPNPFNPNTKINFAIPNTSMVKLLVYNSLGKEISALVGERLNAGSYSVNFNGENFSSGIYYYKLETENFREVKKMILLK